MRTNKNFSVIGSIVHVSPYRVFVADIVLTGKQNGTSTEFHFRLTMMMVHSSQTRIVGKVGGQFLHARWWLWRPILDTHPLPHFGQTKVWDEVGRDGARSFCLLRLFFAALCLSASNSQLAFLTDECQLSRSEASCCHD